MNSGAEQLHEAGEHDQLDAALLEPVAERRVARVAVGVVGFANTAVSMPAARGALEPACLGRVRRHADDLDVLPWRVSISAWRLVPSPETSTAIRKRHAVGGGPARGTTCSTGYLPPVVSRRPASISSSTRARMSARRMCDEPP